jgi:hypothetical protein
MKKRGAMPDEACYIGHESQRQDIQWPAEAAASLLDAMAERDPRHSSQPARQSPSNLCTSNLLTLQHQQQ